MDEIRVDPAALDETGGVLGAAAERVEAARHGLAALGPAGPACGDGPAGASFTRLQTALAAEVDRAGLLLALLGSRMNDAAGAYVATDQAALPAPPARGGP
jgi:uncharacterized protein YukE